MMLTTTLILGVVALAWSNGANDNFKGVATLYGSGTANFRRALGWATVATLAGSLVSLLFAQVLVKTFSGQGLIPDDLISPLLLASVGIAGAATVMLATVLGMPTSTTYALTGALVGAAVVTDPTGLNWPVLMNKFAQPLLISPLLAIVFTAAAYAVMRRIRIASRIERQTCLCLGKGVWQPVVMAADGSMTAGIGPSGNLQLMVANSDQCVERYRGRFVGIDAQTTVDTVHYLSGGAVCFARAVNDTPKIAALLLAANAVGGITTTGALIMVTLAVVIGGVVQAHKVAQTMSKRITGLNPGQGLAANLVTAALVLSASRLGVPVSTTHVSCGAIFGIGLINKHRHWKTITQILTAWVTTLPLGLGLGAALTWMLHRGGL